VKKKLHHSEELGPGSSILFNHYRRAIRVPGFLGARLQSGSVSTARSTGVGDCLYLDFSQQFFAVADGSDRNPTFSREFMKIFATLLSGVLPPAEERTCEKKELHSLKRQLIAESDRILQGLSFGDGCTFTGILLLRMGEEMAGIIFHTGDSLLFVSNGKTGHTRQWSKTNFWMAGRTSRFFQVEDRAIPPRTFLLLATDGINHIPYDPFETREAFIRSLFKTCSPDEIPDRLLEPDETSLTGWDDRAVIAFNPESLPLKGSFLVGGTSPTEENAFTTERKKGRYQDRFLPWQIEQEAAAPWMDL
jgi:hypothetical protein